MNSSRALLPEELIAQFAAITGEQYALTRAEDKKVYQQENRGIYESRTPLVLRPGNTEEVAAILALANRTGTAIVPQGGNTGHVGGAVANPKRAEVILSLSRMNRIRARDLNGNSITVEAGAILANVQQEADRLDRYFPLSLGSQGSCQIGGNLSTNAGGTAVLAYGNARDQVLGLEVVLPSGEIWDGLRRLRKDNTGYDLKDLFIGAEGTLGVITAAVLKLYAKPRAKEVALCGLESPAKALLLLNRAAAIAGSGLTAFELMPRIGIEFVTRHIPATSDPLGDIHPWYVLMEISSFRSEQDARALIETSLTSAIGEELVCDAVIAQSLAQQQAFWRLRETLPEAQKPEGGSIKHDIAVGVADVPDFLDQAGELVLAMVPESRIVSFGHLGDGNIHYNISQPTGEDIQAFMAMREAINRAVHELVHKFNGSISAEHGIGLMKREELVLAKSPLELDLMRRIKQAFDPRGIMNPGKVLHRS